MTYLLVDSGPSYAALADSAVVPRAQVRPLQDAVQLLRAAQARADAIDARRLEAEAEGYATGLADGRIAAAGEASVTLGRTLATLHAEAAAERARLRASAGRLALDIVRRIATDIGPEATVAALAAAAARGAAPGERLVVRVRPEAVGVVGRRLLALSAAVEVQGDDTLDPTDCVIDTALGRALAGLDPQLAAVEQAFAGVESGR